MQTTLISIVRMFDRVGLQTNLSNNKSMVCMPGFIWVQQVVEEYNQRPTGERPIFRVRKGIRVSCEECGGTIDAS